MIEGFFSCPPLSGRLVDDVSAFLGLHGCPGTLDHSLRVSVEAERLVQRFGVDAEAAASAGLLHDVSAVIPTQLRLQAAIDLEIDVLEEERACPMILHQKLSRMMAERIFNVNDLLILDAIGCNTTLRSCASQLDRILFLADKLEWDKPGEHPLKVQLLAALNISLDASTWVYLDFLWQQRDSLPTVHPWLAAAWNEARTHYV